MQETHLMLKFEQNLKSAKMLIENEFYASSVHCSYYALFQFMLCKINQYAKMSFEDIAESTKASDSHRSTIDKLFALIREKQILPEMERVKVEVFNTNLEKLRKKIKDIKKFRAESDYQNCEIDEDKGVCSLAISNELIKKFNEYLP